MRFIIHTTGRANLKFTVPAIPPAGITGTWSESDGAILRPDPSAIRNALPFRYRRAFNRQGGNFWFDKASRFDGSHHTGRTPHLTLHDARGKLMLTLYAIPTAE